MNGVASRPVRRHVAQFKWEGSIHELPSAARKILGTGPYQHLKASYGWLQHETRARSALPLATRLGLWRRGFYAESAAIYDFPRNDPREYLSDFVRITRCREVNSYNDLFVHKLALRSLLGAMGFRQPDTVALLYNGRVLINPLNPGARYVSAEELQELLLGEGPESPGWIVKPESGAFGEEIFMVTHEPGGLRRRRGREVRPFNVPQFLADLDSASRSPRMTLIERRLEQGAFWSDLFPGSANTIRALTMWVPGESAPFLARAVQRIGTADTVPTDNWSGGGISALIDPETGRLGVGQMHPLKARDAAGGLTHHPNTGAAIEGELVPGWTEIAETVLRAAAAVPFNPMAGWDVLVDRSGAPILLEANGNSDVNLLQVHGGLLADPRVRAFYEATGVL